jgi:hypothetical protein
MLAETLSIQDAAASTRRLSLIASAERPASWEFGALMGIGAMTAALTSYVKLNLGIPGHAIVLAVLPIAFGVSLVPRRFAGSIMSASAALTMCATGHTGLGAVGSMVAIGALLDLALRKARPGVGLYAAFVLAGLGGNAVAWVARAVTKLSMLDPGTMGFAHWWAHSLVSYALCGAFAGLLGAALWFQFARRDEQRA